MKTNRTNILLLFIVALLAFSFTSDKLISNDNHQFIKKSINNIDKINTNSIFEIGIVINPSPMPIENVFENYNAFYENWEELRNALENDVKISSYELPINFYFLNSTDHIKCTPNLNSKTLDLTSVRPDVIVGGF